LTFKSLIIPLENELIFSPVLFEVSIQSKFSSKFKLNSFDDEFKPAGKPQLEKAAFN
jgi:hypothetical protein